MKILSFRLSGNNYGGDVADSMYRAAEPFGFERVGTEFRSCLLRRSRHDYLFVGDAEISGVSAWVEIGFDSAQALIEWATRAPLVAPAEPNATNAYRAILAVIDQRAPEPDCTHSALDNCDCYAARDVPEVDET